MQLPFDIHDDYNVENVYDGLMHLGAEICLKTLERIVEADGHPASMPQEEMIAIGDQLKAAPKIFKDTCRIDFNQSAKKVYDFVRGLSPYPGSWTMLRTAEGKESVLKVYATRKTDKDIASAAGSLVVDGRRLLAVCGDGKAVELVEVQMAGKKRMAASDFLNGMKTLDSCKLV